MSKRPTNRSRRDCDSSNNCSTTNGYAIIGDTASSTLYGRRLIGNQIQSNITLINQGPERINEVGIQNVGFPAENSKTILHYLYTEQIHLVSSGESDCVSNGCGIGSPPERITQYYVGAGPIGDFIAAYHTPQVGPWFSHTTNSRIQQFVNNSTLRSPLKAQEAVIVDRLKTIWGIPTTNAVIVNEPSILTVHYEFLEEFQNSYVRQLFLDQYHLVNESPNATYATQVTNLQFRPGTGGTGLYDITGSNLLLRNVKPVWRTNPFTYLRLITTGGIGSPPLFLPTMYRAVLSIPIGGTGAAGITGLTGSIMGPTGYVCVRNGTTGGCGCGCSKKSSCSSSSSSDSSCGGSNSWTGRGRSGTGSICYVGLTGITGVNLSDIQPAEDLTTTMLSFSLYDIGNSNNSSLAWLMQAYTADEDLSVVSQNGEYADTGQTLLIIEGVSTKNRRRANYSSVDGESQVNYNDRVTERGYLRQFAMIVASIYNAYTGAFLSVESLIQESSVCGCESGTCQDANTIRDYPQRESPMVTILQLVSQLYNGGIYPNPSSC